MRYQFDINNVDLVTLDGVNLRVAFQSQTGKSFEQFVGGTVYENVRDIELDDKCKAIHRGEKVEFTERERELFEHAIKTIEFKPGMIERKILQQVIEIKE